MAEARRRCSSCGESYADGVLFCPHDGTALTTRASGPDPFVGQTLAEQFVVEALIGAGAVGSVYRARQLGVERSVALKIMHRELCSNEGLVGRFRREARIAGSLSHPNLVNVLSFFELEHGGERVPCLAFELLDGLSLRSALAARGVLEPTRALHIVLQLADAVGAAHRHGIVHRDLKPENLMLVERGTDRDFVKVLDFGVARADASSPSPNVATRAGAIFGSARYVAPECASGGAATPESDVYALATIAYECLSGATPFTGESAIQVLMQQQSASVAPLTGVPSALARFIEQNLSKAPEARARDGQAFAQGLLEATRDSALDAGLSSRTRRGHAVAPSPSASRSPVIPTPSLRPARSLAPWLVLLCFLLGGAVALLIATRGAP
jgi:serine/threonine-protein kinase